MPANIVLITDDQHRWDFFGDTGTVATLQTPALDRLRAEGTTLTNAYATCPICMPARFGWYHGLYPSQAAQRLLINAHSWPTGLHTMPRALQQAGYHTAVIGKVHSHSGLYRFDLVPHEYLVHDLGFHDVFEVSGKSLAYWYDCRWTHHLAAKGLLDHYREAIRDRALLYGPRQRDWHAPSPVPAEDTMDAFIADRAVEWIEEYPGDRPFFLHVSLCGPHFPIDPPLDYFEKYDPEDMPVPYGVSDVPEVAAWQQLRAAYCGAVEWIDVQVGRVVNQLEADGWLDDTIVIFCTDHGDMLGDRGLNHKSQPYESACRTPITIRYPAAVPENAILDAMVEAVDLPASILAMAGLEGPPDDFLPQTPARSFWQYVTGAASEHRACGYAQALLGDDAWRMICTPDWKYIWRPAREELYNRADDPGELNNVAADPAHAPLMAELRSRLLEREINAAAPNRIPFSRTGKY